MTEGFAFLPTLFFFKKLKENLTAQLSKFLKKVTFPALNVS